jgi:hypothetical protein
MGENIPLHIQSHQQDLQDPMISPEVKALIKRHLAATMQLQQQQQMIQQMQAQQGGKGGAGAPPVGQQAMNAQQGAQPQGPPGSPAGMQSQNGMAQQAGGLNNGKG